MARYDLDEAWARAGGGRYAVANPGRALRFAPGGPMDYAYQPSGDLAQAWQRAGGARYNFMPQQGGVQQFAVAAPQPARYAYPAVRPSQIGQGIAAVSNAMGAGLPPMPPQPFLGGQTPDAAWDRAAPPVMSPGGPQAMWEAGRAQAAMPSAADVVRGEPVNRYGQVRPGYLAGPDQTFGEYSDAVMAGMPRSRADMVSSGAMLGGAGDMGADYQTRQRYAGMGDAARAAQAARAAEEQAYLAGAPERLARAEASRYDPAKILQRQELAKVEQRRQALVAQQRGTTREQRYAAAMEARAKRQSARAGNVQTAAAGRALARKDRLAARYGGYRSVSPAGKQALAMIDRMLKLEEAQNAANGG